MFEKSLIHDTIREIIEKRGTKLIRCFYLTHLFSQMYNNQVKQISASNFMFIFHRCFVSIEGSWSSVLLSKRSGYNIVMALHPRATTKKRHSTSPRAIFFVVALGWSAITLYYSTLVHFYTVLYIMYSNRTHTCILIRECRYMTAVIVLGTYTCFYVLSFHKYFWIFFWNFFSVILFSIFLLK